MIFIKNLIKITEEKYSIGLIHYCPLDNVDGYKINGKVATKEQLEQEGILIDIMEDELDKHRDDIMYYNPIKKEVIWEKKELKNIQDEETGQTLQQRITALEKSNAEMMALVGSLATSTI